MDHAEEEEINVNGMILEVLVVKLVVKVFLRNMIFVWLVMKRE